MFYILLILGGAAGATLVQRMLPAIAVTAVITPFLLGAVWFNERTGVDPLLLASWKWLAGTGDGSITTDCAEYGTGWGGWLGFFVTLALGLLFLAAALASIIGIPASLLGLAGTGLHALFTRSSDLLQPALWLFAGVCGAIVTTGLSARGIHWSTGMMCERP